MARRKSTQHQKPKKAATEPIVSELELAQLGDGCIAYIRTLSNKEARRLFPTVKGLPRGIDLFALCNADGTPIALTDTHSAAMGHAIEGELEVVPLH